jgi:2-methylisocitrate lyase-like PEP mutase family enzyme
VGLAAVSPRDASARRAAFRRLHERGCFVMPNPWDPGSARWLEHLGFPALATTSAGYAFSRGLPDGAVPLDAVLAHVRDVVGATAVPVSADLEAGFGADPAGVAESVRRCVEAGVAGLSVEDATGEPAAPLHPLEVAVARVRAARAALDASGAEVVLTARAECHLVGHPDPLRESLRRLEAYAAAGADVLYAPGLRAPEAVAAVVKAVAPRPVNVLASVGGFTVRALEDLGVRRVSVGGALFRAAWRGFAAAAEEIARDGTFRALGAATPHADLQRFFGEDAARRGGVP